MAHGSAEAQSAETAGKRSRQMPDHDAPPRDILVIDDDPSNLTAIEVALGEFGRRIIKARSGREALRCLLEQDFALILLDVQMPEMDGFETARLIRSRERSAHVPIIFITAFERDDRDVLRGYRLGAVDFMFKPIVSEVLRAKASVFVALQERTEEVRRQEARLRALERREHEQELQEERQRWETEQLRQENRRKDEFLAILSHELRNPLAAIVAGLELIRALEIPNDEFADAHGLMSRQVTHLTRLVDDLLDISRISQGKVALNKERVDLCEVVNHAVESLRLTAGGGDHQVTVSIPESAVWLDGDRDRLIQVVANLLSNSVRYTDPGGKIEVCLDHDDHHAQLCVKDNGRGIEAGVIDNIFDLFAQEHTGGKGLGLGLTLVHRLVQMHNGTVEVNSGGRNLGSEFSVSLPVLADQEHRPSRASSPSPSGARSSANLPVRHLHITLVDDDEDVRYPMSMLLRAWGHEVEIAENGREAIDLVVEQRPDVVLMDIGMPVVDGYEAATRIRERLSDETPKLIAMTGFGSPRDRERTKAVGFDAHIVKPACPADLKQVLLGICHDDHA